MTPEMARLKLAAYLLNPPQQALVPLSEREPAVRALIALMTGDATVPEAARRADQIASAAERPNVPADAPTLDFSREPALTHPLSVVETLELAPLQGAADPASLSAVVLDAAAQLAAACGDDPERRYLGVWRWLGAYIRAAEPSNRRLGAHWDWLPADARLPDDAIWDRMSITAAVAGAGEAPAFLLFALGPVQGFIAEARSTRDLWAGSWLLSWLSWQAVRVLSEELGPDAVLYPSLRGQPIVDSWLAGLGVLPPAAARTPSPATRAIAPFPNKLLALVPHDSAGPLADLMEASVRQAWERLGSEVDAWLGAKARAAWQPQRWHQQMARQLETSWTALAWPPPGGEDAWLDRVQPVGAVALGGFTRSLNLYRSEGRFAHNPGSYYGPVHGLAQRAFAARRLARPFAQAEEPGFKCSLCGARAPALAADARYGEQVVAWQELAGALRPGLLSGDGGERLCAVCLTKRIAPETKEVERVLGGPAPAFPSTSSLATLAFRRALIEGMAPAPDPASPPNEALPGAVHRFLDALERWAPHAERIGATVRTSADVFPSLLARVPQAALDAASLPRRLLQFDGEWLLQESYERARSAFRKEGGNAGALDALTAAEDALQALRREARPARPSAFYAILIADGDRMGRWVSGDQHHVTMGALLNPALRADLERRAGWGEVLAERRLFSASAHAALGSILRDFGRWSVPRAVEEDADGRVVYAGGDDVLALLPARQAVGVLGVLRRWYRAGFLFRDAAGAIHENPPEPLGHDVTILRGMGPDATLSAGLLFVHHLYPLGLALEEARRLEQTAKARGGRDAVAIGLARRSGPEPELEFVSKFERGSRTVFDLIATAGRLLATDGDEPMGSARLPYRLRELASTLGGMPAPEVLRAAVESVAQRGTGSASGRDTLLHLYESLSAPAKSSEPSEQAAAGPIGELVACLRLARFLETEL